ncbi:MAG: iron ABC transporter permease [Vallitaleaceae bacterium]|nr:iron ABC transporter permease [Vallitaleaceae bacterium]
MIKTKNRLKFNVQMFLVILLLFVLMVGSILFGSVHISIEECFKILGGHLPVLNQFISLDQIKDSHITIVMDLRLPRMLLALFAGMGLSVAGCVYQGVFSNPMADPYLLGVSSGAALGATFAILLQIPNAFAAVGSVSAMAFIGAILVLLFVFSMAKSKGKMPTITLILSGIAINYFISSFIALLMLFNRQQLENVYFWTLGSFKDANWTKIIFLAMVVVITLLFIYRYYRELNMIMVSEEQARTLGVSTEKVKKILLIAASLMVAVIVATCGIIGFVGLITPHAARLMTGPNHKKLIPFSMVFGGIFMVLSDTLARSILPNAEISVGIITALFGVPFFLLLLRKSRKTLIV